MEVRKFVLWMVRYFFRNVWYGEKFIEEFLLDFLVGILRKKELFRDWFFLGVGVRE